MSIRKVQQVNDQFLVQTVLLNSETNKQTAVITEVVDTPIGLKVKFKGQTNNMLKHHLSNFKNSLLRQAEVDLDEVEQQAYLLLNDLVEELNL